MVLRRPNSKDIESEKIPIFAVHQFLKNFAGINFRESTFSRVKKGIWLRDVGRNSRNFLPAKISSCKVYLNTWSWDSDILFYVIKLFFGISSRRIQMALVLFSLLIFHSRCPFLVMVTVMSLSILFLFYSFCSTFLFEPVKYWLFKGYLL